MARSAFHRRLFAVALGLALLSTSRSAASIAAVAQDPFEDFRARVEERARIGDVDGVTKLVRQRPNDAASFAGWIAMRAMNGLSPDERKQATMLDQAWREANRSTFVDQLVNYFVGLTAEERASWARAKRGYDAAMATFGKLASDVPPEDERWNELGAASETAARAFEEIRDRYHGAHMWGLAAIAFDETKRGSHANFERALAAYEHAVAGFEAFGFSDSTVNMQRARIRQLSQPAPAPDANKEASGKEPTGKEARNGAAQDGAAVVVPMTFEAIPDLETFERPQFHVDEIYQIWRSIYFNKDGSETTLDNMAGSPKFKRVTSAAFEVDADLDGTYEQKVAISGNRQPIEFTIGTGEDKRRWAGVFTVGRQKEFYQTMEVDLSPRDDSLQVYLLSAASVVGTLGSTKIRVIDDDMNGVFGNPSQTWGDIGMSKDHFMPIMDSIVVGDGKRARPWSDLVHVDGQWYRVAIAKNGMELSFTPEKLETGVVKLDYKGPVQPTWWVLKGLTDTEFENTCFDVAGDAKKGVAVPVGDWMLYFGELRKGKQQQVMKAVIVPQRDATPIKVEAGQEVVIKAGAPYGFDFAFQHDGDKVTVLGDTVAVIGSGGERYERLWGCIPRLEASWRKAGTKKGSKGEKAAYVGSNDELEKYKWDRLWKPIDLELSTKEPVEKVEVQLVEKKNKLLGPIESAWKE